MLLKSVSYETRLKVFHLITSRKLAVHPVGPFNRWLKMTKGYVIMLPRQPVLLVIVCLRHYKKYSHEVWLQLDN